MLLSNCNCLHWILHNIPWTCTTRVFLYWLKKESDLSKERPPPGRPTECHDHKPVNCWTASAQAKGSWEGTCLPNEYTGNEDNDSIPERAISFDCTVITCSEKGKPAWLFTYKVKDGGHQGESPPKPKGRETGKEWLEYFVDSLSLEIFTNGLRNPLSEMRQHSCFILRAWEELHYLLFSYSCYLDFIIFLECF